MLVLLVSLSLATELQTGDVIFHESRSSQSAALQAATGSRYTHVGLIVVDGETVTVLEAVEPVKETPLDEWIARGVDGHAVAKRPREATPEAAAAAVSQARESLGLHYDLGFRWDDTQIYCSELVYKAWAAAGLELAELKTHADYDLSDPGVQRAARKRYPKGLPRDEPVIALSDLMESEALETVRTWPGPE